MPQRQSRKIFNYESVILSELTFEKEGYYPDAWGPTSNKYVWATCRTCGQPSRISKNNFNKAGSACHKACKIEVQSQDSPFKKEEVREKARKTNLERYGVESANQNPEIAKKISEARLMEECKNKIAQTNIKKYGCVNVFQNEEIKEKIKQTNLEKYGVPVALQNETIKEKSVQTTKERYGKDNVMQVEEIKDLARKNFDKAVKNNVSGAYNNDNFLTGEIFWNEIEQGVPLPEICKKYDMKYGTIASTLSHDKFKEKFRKLYTYPRHQKQNALKEILNRWGIEVLTDDKNIISPLELDIYVPDLNFAIEFNGSYWHSEACCEPKQARKKQYRKTIKCREKGIRLFHIFESTWDNREKQILGFIKSILGKNTESVGARQCAISYDPCPEFIENNHIQGNPGRILQFFNLVYNDEIVATMTASRHHRQGTDSKNIILSRLCFKNEYNIKGGSERLFSAFKAWSKEQGYENIVSFSDNAYTEGGVYNRLGFTMEKEYGPDYFYWDVNRNCYVSKQSQQKSKTGCPEGMTEREWCLERKLYRIWDCGKKRWIYKL